MPKPARKDLTHRLRSALTTVREATEHNFSLDDAAKQQLERTLQTTTRRDFLGTAASAAGLMLANPLCSYGTAVSPSRIVVVGAGLAGLRFAQEMWTRRRIPVTVYEANTRLGGRQWTNRNFFSHGQVAEHGAEFISSEHTSIRRLAKRYDLPLAVVSGGAESCCNDVAWLDGSYYPMRQLLQDLQAAQPAIDAAYASAPFPTLYNRYTRAGYMLDHTSAADWIALNIPGGVSSRLGRILLTDVTAEYGCEASEQSALNLIYLLGGGTTGGLAGTDEKYHVAGGNDQIASGLASELPPGTIQTGMMLLALQLNSDGSYTCTFQQGAGTKTVFADHVVLSIPFPQLKKVDLSQAGFSTVKLAAIQNYALGTNAKLALQFEGRPWSNRDGYSGVCFTDPLNFQESWDATVSQKGPAGILERYPGGNAGGANAFPGAAPHGPAPQQYALDFLNAVEGPFPGCVAKYNGKAWLDWWQQDPLVGGAYGCYGVGNYTSFAGIENVREGGVHFCGEQTDLGFQGFMEGAVRSAERLVAHWPRL